MIDKQKILTTLRDSLNSNTWNQIKNALLGQELIAFGTEVLYLNALLYEALTDPLFIDKATIAQLKASAHLYNVPIDNYKPGYIKIKIKSAQVPKTYAPFTIKMNVGGSVFTNIEFVSDANEITLYQGYVYTTTSFGRSSDSQNIAPVTTDAYKMWTKFSELSSGINYSTYVKLGEKCCSASVRVFYRKTGQGLPYTYYQESFVSPTAPMYKVLQGRDGSLNVIFGDGIWARLFDTSYDWQIFWLDYNITTFRITSGNLVDLNGTSNRELGYDLYLPEQKDEFDNAPVGIYVLSYEQGFEADEAYYRQQLKHAIAQKGLVVSKEQLKGYVNGFEGVLDCNPLLTGVNDITVYVKPTVQTDRYFSNIEEHLRLYGEMCINYHVVPADWYKFSVVLASVAPLSIAEKQQIVNQIEDQFSYAKLKFDEVISARYIAEVASSITSVKVYATLLIEETVDEYLLLTPEKGSVRVYNEGNIYAWDSDGLLYARASESVLISSPVFIGGSAISSGSVLPQTVGDLETTLTGGLQINTASIIKSKEYFVTVSASNELSFYNKEYFNGLAYQAVLAHALNPIKVVDYSDISGDTPVKMVNIGNYIYYLNFQSSNNRLALKRLVINSTSESYVRAFQDNLNAICVAYNTSTGTCNIINFGEWLLVVQTNSSSRTGADATLVKKDGTKVILGAALLFAGKRVIADDGWHILLQDIESGVCLISSGDLSESYLLRNPVVQDSRSSVLFEIATKISLTAYPTDIRVIDDTVYTVEGSSIKKYQLANNVYATGEAVEFNKTTEVGTVDYLSRKVSGISGMQVNYTAASTLISNSETKYPLLDNVSWQ